MNQPEYDAPDDHGIEESTFENGKPDTTKPHLFEQAHDYKEVSKVYHCVEPLELLSRCKAQQGSKDKQHPRTGQQCHVPPRRVAK
jgi:hypothetical protein